MPICLKCTSIFPKSILVDNQPRNLQNRKYCLVCSPFKSHNTLQLHTKSVKSLHSRDYHTFDTEQKNIFNKKTYEYQKNRRYSRKYYYVNLKGGKCQKCGYHKNYAALSFHHRNPKNKSFCIDGRNLSSKSHSVILKELEKCDLLCLNCHAELHNPKLEWAELDLNQQPRDYESPALNH